MRQYGLAEKYSNIAYAESKHEQWPLTNMEFLSKFCHLEQKILLTQRLVADAAPTLKILHINAK